MPDNWVKAALVDRGYGLHEVEGDTVQDDEVAALLDYIPASKIPQVTESAVKDVRGAEAIDAKARLAEKLGCSYYLVRNNGQVDLFELADTNLHTSSRECI